MKKFLSLVLALVMTMSLVTVSAGAKDFTDDSEITYKEAVDVISALGVVDGYSGGDFRPDDVLTRGAAAKIICNLILGPTTASALAASTAPFKDVPVTNTFAGYITYCSQQGIISGYADGTFRPTGTLSGNAFMKMLLGALGYDSSIEKYTGPNWQVSVIKQASGIGLDDGNDEFVGSKAVTREEAALYAFNMLQATMVEYDKKDTIVVGDITINSASTRKDVENTAKNETIEDDDKMQFAEKYFDDLKLSDGTDDFARPANVWRLKSEKIGTYAKEADATYTAKVAVDDIYADLDLGSSVDKKDVSVYIDGVENTKGKVNVPVDITKNDDDTKFGANGVLTEVFYDDDDDTVVITMVNTYVGTINRSVAAKGNKDAYVEIAVEDVKPEGVNGIEDFETVEEFEDDAYVLYTYSQSAEEVKSVALAEEVTGTVTRAENANTDRPDKKALTIDGTKYNASFNVAGQDVGAVSVDEEYTIYLDAYGYMIYVEENDEIGDYALLVDTQDKGNFSSNRALLVFADGTEKVVDTTENYKNGSDKIANATIVTYRVDEDGDYTLKPVDSKKVSKTDTDSEVNFGSNYNDGSTNFSMTNDKASIDLTDKKAVTSNSKTVFVVYDDTNDDYNVYTGIKNAPTIKATSNKKVEAFAYCKSGKMATVMFIFVQDSSIIEDSSKDTLFLAKESVSNLIHDKDGDYFEYQAVVNGEVKTVKVDESLGKTQNGMFKSYSVDKYGVITKLNSYDTYTDGATKQCLTGSGVDKVSADYTVILDTNNQKETISVADDAKFFYVDEDGNIESISYRSVSKDSNDKVYAVVDEYLVEYLVIEEVDDKNNETETPANEVAKIGRDTYSSLENAIEAASSGDTIVLLQDTKLGTSSYLNEGVTLDGNGYTITYTGTKSAIIMSNNCVVENVTLRGTAPMNVWKGAYGIQAYNAVNTTISDVTIKGFNAAILVNGSETTLTDVVDVSSNGFGGIEVSKGDGVTADSVLTVEGTVINDTESSKAPTAWTECAENGENAQGSVIGADWTSVVYEKESGSKYQIWWLIDSSNAPEA